MVRDTSNHVTQHHMTTISSDNGSATLTLGGNGWVSVQHGNFVGGTSLKVCSRRFILNGTVWEIIELLSCAVSDGRLYFDALLLAGSKVTTLTFMFTYGNIPRAEIVSDSETGELRTSGVIDLAQDVDGTVYGITLSSAVYADGRLYFEASAGGGKKVLYTTVAMREAGAPGDFALVDGDVTDIMYAFRDDGSRDIVFGKQSGTNLVLYSSSGGRCFDGQAMATSKFGLSLDADKDDLEAIILARNGKCIILETGQVVPGKIISVSYTSDERLVIITEQATGPHTYEFNAPVSPDRLFVYLDSERRQYDPSDLLVAPVTSAAPAVRPLYATVTSAGGHVTATDDGMRRLAFYDVNGDALYDLADATPYEKDPGTKIVRVGGNYSFGSSVIFGTSLAVWGAVDTQTNVPSATAIIVSDDDCGEIVAQNQPGQPPFEIAVAEQYGKVVAVDDLAGFIVFTDKGNGLFDVHELSFTQTPQTQFSKRLLVADVAITPSKADYADVAGIRHLILADSKTVLVYKLDDYYTQSGDIQFSTIVASDTCLDGRIEDCRAEGKQLVWTTESDYTNGAQASITTQQCNLGPDLKWSNASILVDDDGTALIYEDVEIGIIHVIEKNGQWLLVIEFVNETGDDVAISVNGGAAVNIADNENAHIFAGVVPNGILAYDPMAPPAVVDHAALLALLDTVSVSIDAAPAVNLSSEWVAGNPATLATRTSYRIIDYSLGFIGSPSSATLHVLDISTGSKQSLELQEDVNTFVVIEGTPQLSLVAQQGASSV